MKNLYDEEYYENGIVSGKSLYTNFRWLPELTIPLAHHIIQECQITNNDSILDFGCAKGYLVKALRLLGMNAFGVDVSEYAINSVDQDMKEFCNLIEPLEFLGNYDWVIAKDIFEHISYESIEKQIQILSKSCDNLFVLVPLGDGVKYYVDSYELDKTHNIREDLIWWEELFKNNGFSNIKKSTYNCDPFKNNYKHYENGNGLFIVSK